MNCRWTILFLFCLISFSSCKREQRSFRAPPAAAELSDDVPANTPVRPGPSIHGTDSTNQPVSVSRLLNEPYGRELANNAQGLSDGQSLFEWFNCSGCHAHGGGGMGPPLMDKAWLYGSDPPHVYESILEGRPNGMPSYRGRIADYQIWELVAFVRSMSGHASPNAASGREDHMAASPPPNSIPKQSPIPATEPTTGPATSNVPATGTSSATEPAAPQTRPEP
jgi:cytochrome c oxidase cbb3-type subunit 3